jgi:hypothetical protein
VLEFGAISVVALSKKQLKVSITTLRIAIIYMHKL